MREGADRKGARRLAGDGRRLGDLGHANRLHGERRRRCARRATSNTPNATGTPEVLGRHRLGRTLVRYVGVLRARPQNTWGNVERRGLLTGPAYYNLDASIVKVIRVGTKRAEIRADFFNALNISHYANPNGTLGNANFGRITGILAQTERTIRFGGRFLFYAFCRRLRRTRRSACAKVGRLVDWKIGRFKMPLGCRSGLGRRAHVRAGRRRSAQTRVDFQRDVRPILSDNCFLCHGPDASTRKANLRLDLHEDALAPRRNGAPIVPGKPEREPALQKDHGSRSRRGGCRRSRSHKTLSDAQKETLRRWIEQGAEWKQHWAFVAPVRPALPDVKDRKWARTPIDRFVLAKIEAAGLAPNPEADRRALIRRVSLDLTGLPPRPEDVAAFVADTSPDAYVKVVNRLLSSPHYGEHRARYWLDAARYGDTNGLHYDNYRGGIWPYRDWVVRAFNAQSAVRSICRRAAGRRSAAESRRSISASPPGSSGATRPPMKTASSRRKCAFSTSRIAPTRPAPCSSD